MGVFVGIISGFAGGVIYNRYYNFRKLPDALAFFNGKRFVPMVCIAWSVIISMILALVWPVVQSGINAFGVWIAEFFLHISDPGTIHLRNAGASAAASCAASYADHSDELYLLWRHLHHCYRCKRRRARYLARIRCGWHGQLT